MKFNKLCKVLLKEYMGPYMLAKDHEISLEKYGFKKCSQNPDYAYECEWPNTIILVACNSDDSYTTDFKVRDEAGNWPDAITGSEKHPCIAKLIAWIDSYIKQNNLPILTKTATPPAQPNNLAAMKPIGQIEGAV